MVKSEISDTQMVKSEFMCVTTWYAQNVGILISDVKKQHFIGPILH